MAAAQMRTAREYKAAAPLRMAETMKKLVESGVWGEEATADIEDMTPFQRLMNGRKTKWHLRSTSREPWSASFVPCQSSIDESRPGAPPHGGAKGQGVAGRDQSTFDRIL